MHNLRGIMLIGVCLLGISGNAQAGGRSSRGLRIIR